MFERHTHACTRTQISPPPFALTLAFRFYTTGPPSNVHSHMHKRTHKHTHYATRSQTLLVCVWNERRVVRKNRLPEKRALPSLGDKHHSVTRFSGHCFLTVYFLLCLSVCLFVPLSFSLSHFPMSYYTKARSTKYIHYYLHDRNPISSLFGSFSC